jgi:hypothetical protein
MSNLLQRQAGEAQTDLLRTAVVDITMLVATCRALRSRPELGKLPARPKPLHRLRTQLRRASAAYIDTFAGSKRGVMDEDLLASCRVEAEREMPRALRHVDELRHLMSTAPGALAGVAAARQDLWRLAHMSIHLRQGVTALHDAGDHVDKATVKKPGARLRRRLRRALIAYSRRAAQRSSDHGERVIFEAREAALSEIGRRGAEEADCLAELEASAGAAQPLIAMGVANALYHLAVDWLCLED